MERIKLAEKIISTCREMNASGLNQGTSGNVSARYTGGMLITPSGIAYSKMTPDMIVFVDDKGKPEAGKIPSSEWLIHLACYKARPELNAVPPGVLYSSGQQTYPPALTYWQHRLPAQ